jgi:bacillolysin
MKKLLAAVVLLTATVAFAQKSPAPDAGYKIDDQDPNGVPTFVSGNIGNLGAGAPDKAAKDFLKAQKHLLHQTGNEDFDASSVSRDGLGQTHVKFQQTIKGLPVFGAEYVVHSDASGKVIAMNGRFAPADEKLPRNAAMKSGNAMDRALAQAGLTGARVVDNPTLMYYVNEKSNAFLAWAFNVEYTDDRGPQRDLIFADATYGDFIGKAPHNYYLKSRKVYTANNGTSLPGTLLWSEGGTQTSDTTAQAAYNYAGNVYDFYKNVFNRDSYDNAGATIISSVHYSTSYNNAFWNGSQMVYGDGDGTQFTPLSKALDVDAHELTHAVTERTANLTYSNESGALNEATSDILGNSCEAYSKNGGTPNANTWKVGEDIYTPSTAGDALRYMNNPTADGYSTDYYPERLTGTSDNGGVHGNSGIANLAYYLMVMGGTHPRSKTTVTVTPLSATSSTSLDMAQRIWYRALTVYFTSSTNFQGARTATVQAATDLYGAAAAATVTAAWDCVAVPGGSGGGGGGVTTMTNGQTLTGLSGATGTWAYFKITVPTGQTQLKVTMSGGTGDADLYVRQGAQPTSTTYTCRPYLTGNAETCTMTNPVAGDWYIGLNAYAAYSGVSLNATYSGSSGGTCTGTLYSGSLSGTGASAIQPNGTYYQTTVTGTNSGKLTGPASGADFDLYLYKWNGSAWAQVGASESSTANENISYSGTAGYYEFKVLSYSGSGSYTLCINHP